MWWCVVFGPVVGLLVWLLLLACLGLVSVFANMLVICLIIGGLVSVVFDFFIRILCVVFCISLKFLCCDAIVIVLHIILVLCRFWFMYWDVLGGYLI